LAGRRRPRKRDFEWRSAHGFASEYRCLESCCPFNETAANTIEPLSEPFDVAQVVVKDRAVTIASQLVRCDTLVGGKRRFGFLVEILQHVEANRQLGRESCVHQIEALTELQDRANDRRIVNFASSRLIDRKLSSSVEPELPEIDPFAEPVGVVLAFLERLTREQPICDRSIDRSRDTR
jgi:hypothetical protein